MKRHTKSRAVIEVAGLAAMEIAFKHLRKIGALFGLALVVLTAGLGAATANAQQSDSLYVGDQSDNTVKRFDADTGAFQGEFVRKQASAIKGPRGLIFNSEGDLLVSNQNALTNKSGDILLYGGQTGEFLERIVSHSDRNAPFAPRGIVLRNGTLFVADFLGGNKDEPGRLLAYTEQGEFLADLTPDPGDFPREEFHPRGVVVGPDGFLYVSNFPNLATGNGGHVLRFDPTNGSFVDVFASDDDADCAAHLHRPEGLVFGPDGKLYVTAFRANATDNDKILIFDNTGSCVDQINLDQVGQARAFAQAILFGPGGDLFVPISGDGPDTGAVRRYNVTTKAFSNFVPPATPEGPLGQGWFLTFGDTNPGTLAYEPPGP